MLDIMLIILSGIVHITVHVHTHAGGFFTSNSTIAPHPSVMWATVTIFAMIILL